MIKTSLSFKVRKLWLKVWTKSLLILLSEKKLCAVKYLMHKIELLIIKNELHSWKFRKLCENLHLLCKIFYFPTGIVSLSFGQKLYKCWKCPKKLYNCEKHHALNKRQCTNTTYAALVNCRIYWDTFFQMDLHFSE